MTKREITNGILLAVAILAGTIVLGLVVWTMLKFAGVVE